MSFEYTFVIVMITLPPKFEFVQFSPLPHLTGGFNIILFGKEIVKCDTFTGSATTAS